MHRFIPGRCGRRLNYGIRPRFAFSRHCRLVHAGMLRVVLAVIEPRDALQVSMKTQNTLEVEGLRRPALIAETWRFLIPALEPDMSTDDRPGDAGAIGSASRNTLALNPLVIQGPRSRRKRASFQGGHERAKGRTDKWLSSSRTRLSSPAILSVRRRRATDDFPMCHME